MSHTGGHSATRDGACADAGDPSRRRERILDAAAAMFAEYGYHGASVRDISKRVRISHPGMLHHFASKEVLLHAVIDRLEEHAQDALTRVGELAPDADMLLENLAAIWHPASATMQLLATLSTDAVNQEHPGRFRVARLRRVHEYVLGQCFAQLGDRGRLRAGIDPAFAGRAVLDLVLGHAVREKTVRAMQHQRYGDSPEEDLARLARAFLDLRGATPGT
ncbi:TetR/AcrR family transcriptional regulator [Brachybacterium sp. GCM10030268]|uniref:TetR/AcrR family transcriptional regulator n=1 Tax=Brachybacterium sp. GCM10030268 TaxID=3273382 RepID=UPI003611C5DE